MADPERLGAEDAVAAAVGLEPPALLCHLGEKNLVETAKMLAWAMTTCGLATKNAGLTWPND